MNFETKAIRLQLERSQHREHSVPLYNTSSFIFHDPEQMRLLFEDSIPGDIYSRYSNPNTREFEEKICALEGTEDAVATASGMAAIFSSLAALLKSGDHIIASRAVFGASFGILTGILPNWGIEHTFVDASDPASWKEAIQDNTKMLFLETPSNPGLEVIDLDWAGHFARQHGLILNVDNCFASPYLQNPAQFGADLVTHSATKFIDGQGRAVGGIVTGRAELIDVIRKFNRKTGPSMAPFNAWLFSKSLETLPVRMERHCSNALALAQWLEKQEVVNRVNYPFLESHAQYQIAKKQMKHGGGIVTFELKGGLPQGKAFLESIQMISLSANLGDTRTIATHPASTTHSKLSEADQLAVGITPGLIRVSVGLEHIDDIRNDLAQAFKKSAIAVVVS
ncbi:MAG: aminotransferase class I/II-fold pyridoxal phosphate-dependent enzyme [Bacteroidota bacterium]